MEKTVEIKADNYISKVNLSKGANCISLINKKYGANILREPNYLSKIENPYVYGMTILYPANRISGGEFLFEGRNYKLPINEPQTNCHLHGNIHSAAFEVVEKGENFVKCGYKQNEAVQCPCAFKIEMSYFLSAKGLEQRTEIFNLSDHTIPNFLGFHTTFNIPFVANSSAENITVKADVGEEIERDMETYLPTGNILPEDDITCKIKNATFYPFGRKISRHYRSCGDGIMEIADNKNRLKIVYENDKKFAWRMIYNGNADQYICLEPMTSMANCQNSPFDRDFAGFDSIETNTSKVYISKIRMEEF